MTKPEIIRHADPASLMQATAEHVVATAQAAIAKQGRFSIALSGGSTPRALYTLLATKTVASSVDWSRAHIFWGDERCVPPDHTNSNYHMAQKAWLANSAIPPENVYRIEGEREPASAAAAYEETLRAFFSDGALPRFDLILLGMGDDGHTASLFPGTAVIHETSRWVVAHFVEKLQTWRITLTPVVINAAANVTFLVSGAGKAERLNEVLNSPFQPTNLPSQIVKPVTGRLRWFTDIEVDGSS